MLPSSKMQRLLYTIDDEIKRLQDRANKGEFEDLPEYAELRENLIDYQAKIFRMLDLSEELGESLKQNLACRHRV